jgi:hypothetical protein
MGGLRLNYNEWSIAQPNTAPKKENDLAIP